MGANERPVSTRTVTSPRLLRGEVVVPGDKSITHRAFIFNAIAGGSATVTNHLRGEDCLATMRCLRALGVTIKEKGEGTAHITGRGGQGLKPPKETLDAANSGTTMRLMSGLLASQPFQSVITGDESLRRRPMARVIEPLRLMGADIHGAANDTLAPLTIRGGRLRGIRYRMPVASAQVKSAILIAGLFAEGETTVEEPAVSRDHTERMFKAMGAKISVEGLRITVQPGVLKPVDVAVPGDISSAAYWMVAAAIHSNANVLVRGVGVNPSRTGVIDVLREMGAKISLERERLIGGEPVADIRVTSSRLKGVKIGGAIIPRLIDELPILAVAAAMAEGATEIRDAEEMRTKESDRIATTASELTKLGAKVRELKDGMVIEGGAKLTGAVWESHGDHRLAMCAAVAGLVASGKTTINEAQAVDVSYPRFWADLESLAV
ncbi:MAG: 3-phosphoshikimate 1-carboxyvinyltransferase [Chloroflexi bacterium]|nr:3-phosphoshikimate 1-carboxyvinyltransferase [Chloroflexota bacterium]